MKRTSIHAAVTFSLLLVPAYGAHAQAKDTSRLESVVVSATKGVEPGIPLTQAVTVIAGADLRARGVTRVSDALREVPGAMLVQSGSFGSVTSLFLRGGESRYTKVLIDGVPVNAAGGFFDLSHLTTDNIERIEIVRGPASVVYGADAVSGVIQIFTRRAGLGTRANGSIRAGTFGTRDASADFSRERDANGFSLGGGYHVTDGTLPFNNQYRNGTLSAASQWRWPMGQGITAYGLQTSLRYTAAEFHYPTDFTGAPVDSNSYRVQHRLTLSSVASAHLSSLSAALLLGSNDVSDLTEDIAVPFGGTSPRHSVFRSRGVRRNAEVRLEFGVPFYRSWLHSLGLTSGVEYQTERERSGNSAGAVGAKAAPTDGFLDSRRNVAYYSELLGLMFSRISFNLSGRRDDNSEYGAINTSRLGASAPVVAGVRFRASVATAFNAPAFNQIHPTTFTAASPGLEPERSRSWELGVERIFGANRFRVGGDYFNQRFSQMIQFVNGGPPNFLGSFANLTGASANGYEVEAELRPADPIRVTGSFTVVTPRAREIPPSFAGSLKVGDALLRRPTHSGALGATYSRSPGRSFGATATYVGKRPDLDFSQFPSPTLTLPAYVKLDLAAGWRLLALGKWSGLLLTARVENALNKKYSDVIGFPAPGRVVLIGASFSGLR